MTKLLHKSASIAVTLISLSLIVLVVLSVLPLVKGDMGLEEEIGRASCRERV